MVASMTAQTLADELGIGVSTLRAWLRKTYPRPAGERGPWRLTDEHAEAARVRFGPLAADRREREAGAAVAALEALGVAAPPTAARDTPDTPASLLPPRDPAPARPTPTLPRAPRRSRAVERDRLRTPETTRTTRRGPARPPRRPIEPPPRRAHPDTPARRRAVSRGWQIEASVFSLALLLGGLLFLGVFTGVSPAWVGAGASMIAFGLALDAYARALGGYAANEAGQRGWMWACILGGSPVVLFHGVVRRGDEPAIFELAPLVALGALVVIFTLLGAAASSQGGGV